MKNKKHAEGSPGRTTAALCVVGFAIASLVLALAPARAASGTPSSASWRGSYHLPRSAQPVRLAIAFDGGRALVALPGGYSGVRSVPVQRRRDHVRFRLPGRPSSVAFDGKLTPRSISGTVVQGAVRGTFGLARSTAAPLPESAPGAYRFPSGRTIGIVDLGGLRLVDLASGDIHGLFRSSATRYRVGSTFGIADPVEGEVVFSTDGRTLRLSGERAVRVPFRQEEVRFRAGGATLAGTLTLPEGAAPHAAIAIVHGSGRASRAGSQIFAAWFAIHGIAVLAYDKRGVGQSGGAYPGGATETGIDRLARDAEAAVRFLAAQPDVDARRIGLWGASQAGWIIPLAASRAPVAFAVIGVGPTVTVGEESFYSDLTNDGEVGGLTASEAEAQLGETAPSGFDPIPSIRSLRIPVLWVYGAEDRSIPTHRSVAIIQRLRSETGADFTSIVFPRAGHSLLETPNGLNTEIGASRRFAPGLFDEMIGWLRSRVGPLP